MRLATAGFSHEANTFAPAAATIDVWRRSGILEGDRIRAQHRAAASTMSGFLAYEAEAADVELVPLVYSRITPTGASTREAYEYLCELMIGALRREGPWDGVLLPLHGAAVAEHHRDADGEFVRRVRAVVGPDVPIGVTLDMHANISRRLMAAADVVTVYQTNPHVDAAEQGLACARLIGRTVRGEIRPAMALADPPLVPSILRQGTAEKPMAGLVRLARAHRQRPRVLSVSVVEGFPYADVEHMGMSFVAVTDNDPVLAKEITGVLAVAAWERRTQMVGEAPSPDEALRRAAGAVSAAGPVVLLDTGDNVLGGSPGDSTHLLHAARRLGITGVAVSICDPVAVAACDAVGPGGRVRATVGGRTDARHGEPFPVTGEVLAVAAGTFEDPGPTHGGIRHFDVGRSASIRSDDGFVLAIHSRPVGTVSQEQFRMVGIEPRGLEIIAAKGVHSPRPAFEPIASALIWANTPGATGADLTSFTYGHRRTPMYPYEPHTQW